MSKHAQELGHYGWCAVCGAPVRQRTLSSLDHSVTYYCEKGDMLSGAQLRNTPTGMPPGATSRGLDTPTELLVPIGDFSETALINALDCVVSNFMTNPNSTTPTAERRHEAGRAAKWLASKYAAHIFSGH